MIDFLHNDQVQNLASFSCNNWLIFSADLKAFIESPESSELTKDRIKAMVIGLVSMQSLIKQRENLPQKSLSHLTPGQKPRTLSKDGPPDRAKINSLMGMQVDKAPPGQYMVSPNVLLNICTRVRTVQYSCDTVDRLTFMYLNTVHSVKTYWKLEMPSH